MKNMAGIITGIIGIILMQFDVVTGKSNYIQIVSLATLISLDEDSFSLNIN